MSFSIWLQPVPREKTDALKAIAAKPDKFYSGTMRGFITSDSEEFWIDTRYDEDLRRAGIIDADPHSRPE